MTVAEAAALLHMSAPTVRRLVQRGELAPADPLNPGLRRQPRLRFTRAELARFQTARAATPAHPRPRAPRKPRP